MQKMSENQHLDLEKVHSEKMMSSIAILQTMSKKSNVNVKRIGQVESSTGKDGNIIPIRRRSDFQFLNTTVARLGKMQNKLSYIMMEETTPTVLKTQSKIIQQYLKYTIKDSSQNINDDNTHIKNICSLSEFEQQNRKSLTNQVCAKPSRKSMQIYSNGKLKINTGSLSGFSIHKKMNNTMKNLTVDNSIIPVSVEDNSSQLALLKDTSNNIEKIIKKEDTLNTGKSYVEKSNSLNSDTIKYLTDLRTCTPNNKDYRKLYIVETISDSELSSDDEVSIDIDNHWVLHPDNKWIKWFRILLLFVIVYMFISEPILIAFYDVDPEPARIISYIIDILFGLDFGINFFIGYFDENEQLILNNKKIAINYLLSNFLRDILSALPFASLLYLTEELNKANRVFKLTLIIKILRLLRLIKVMKFYFHSNIRDNLLKKIHLVRLSAFGSLIQFFFGFVFFNHISTCLWIFLSKMDYPNWISEACLQDSQNYEIYIASLYFNFTTILTIGYGDIKPKSYVERLYNIMLMCFGVFIYSMVLSIVSNTVQKQQKLQKKRNKKSELVKEIINKYQVEEQLSKRLGRYVKLYMAMNRYEKNFLLDTLPKHLKNEIVYQMYQKNVRSLKFFQNASNDEFKYRLACMLHLIRFKKKEYIIQSGDFIEEFYMIKKGIIQIEKETYYNRKVKIAELNENEHFGEVYMHLFIKSPVDFRVKSRTAEVFYLTKSDFLELFADFPHIIASAMKVSWINAVRMEAKARKIFRILKRQITRGSRMRKDSNASPTQDSTNQDSRAHIKNQKRLCKQLTTIREEPEKGLINEKTNLANDTDSLCENRFPKKEFSSTQNFSKEKPFQREINQTYFSQSNLGECTNQGIQPTFSGKVPISGRSFHNDTYDHTKTCLTKEKELSQRRNIRHNTPKNVFHLPLIDYKEYTDHNSDRKEQDENTSEKRLKLHTKEEPRNSKYLLKKDFEKSDENEEQLKEDSENISELSESKNITRVFSKTPRASSTHYKHIPEHKECNKTMHRSNSIHRLRGEERTLSENYINRKGKKHFSQPKNISGFLEIILNMEDINRALKNPKDLLAGTFSDLNSKKVLFEYEKQLDKINDIYDEILLGLLKNNSSMPIKYD